MAVKTISLSEEAYAKLEAERAEGESFESVIERYSRKRSLRDIVGFLKENEAAELERIIEALRGEEQRTHANLSLRKKGLSKKHKLQIPKLQISNLNYQTISNIQ